MTDRGTFIINGIERVVVSQLIVPRGIFTSENIRGRRYYGAKIIPNREHGSNLKPMRTISFG